MQKLIDIEELEKGQLILLFTTDWCPDCIILKQYINLIVAKYQEWKFILIDSEKHLELAKHYDIMGIPSFVALKDGEKLSDFISKQAKSYEEIRTWIENIEE